jgi:decaprenylphospho-beta-D-erythro-pentofuranosid-2-ulose 2-reductase
MSTVLIVGASSAIGRAIAHRWAKSGAHLLLAGRDMDDLERTAKDMVIRHGVRAQVVRFDALDTASYELFWKECVEKCGGDLAGIVAVQGYLPVQAEAQKDLGIVHEALVTNFGSVASILSLAANEFEKRQRGFIVAVSSVAGDRGRQSNYVYGSVKAAVSTFMAGLHHRLWRSNVVVVDVKPGFVDTAMTWGLPGMFLVAQPEKIAAAVWRGVRERRSVVYAPWFWRYIMLIIKLVPGGVFKRSEL